MIFLLWYQSYLTERAPLCQLWSCFICKNSSSVMASEVSLFLVANLTYEALTRDMVPTFQLRKHLWRGHATEAFTTLRQIPNIWPDTIHCNWHGNKTRSTLLDACLLPKWQHSIKIKIAIFDHKPTFN